MKEIKVAAKSEVGKVAGAITAELKANGEISAIAVGPHAVNQLVKAIATSKGQLASTNDSLTCAPSFKEVTIDDEKRTGVLFHITRIEGGK